jgi:hypothetical protein
MGTHGETKRSGSTKDITPVSSSLDFNNPRSLVSIVPQKMQELMLNVPMEYLEMNEYELENVITPNAFVNRVRLAFWQEYERAQGEVRKMNIHNIALSIGTLDQHIYRIMRDQLSAAWILCPPNSYTIFLDEALDFGLKRLRDHILTLPLRNPETGEVDHENANLILKTVAFLDMRKNGAVVQKTMNLNLNATNKDMKEVTKEMNLVDLDKKIQELEERTKRVDKRTNQPEVEEAETA